MSHLTDNDIINKKRRAVAKWLLLGVVMILIQILLGGITRLTGSGLSITEWKPILGAVPPLNDRDWNTAFELYKTEASGQFVNHNSDYTMSDFKAIYFWEWMHREWARLLGVVFLIGFVFFLAKKYFDKKMGQPFVVLFLLGALQGAVGWIMVASGLNPDDTHVSHIKLALHFMFALVLLCYTFWFALKLLIPESKRLSDDKLKSFSLSLLVLLGLQLVYGAFMAGLKAASAAATWPDVNGTYMPENVNRFGGQVYRGLQIITDNPIMVHYIHRTLAYLLFGLVVVWVVKAKKVAKAKRATLLGKASICMVVLVFLQVLLGIITVLNGHLMTQNKFLQFEWLALLHQFVAVAFLMNLVLNYYLVNKRVKTN
jgi:cytochrome c oxidase assembly protein subunit 15